MGGFIWAVAGEIQLDDGLSSRAPPTKRFCVLVPLHEQK